MLERPPTDSYFSLCLVLTAMIFFSLGGFFLHPHLSIMRWNDSFHSRDSYFNFFLAFCSQQQCWVYKFEGKGAFYLHPHLYVTRWKDSLQTLTSLFALCSQQQPFRVFLGEHSIYIIIFLSRAGTIFFILRTFT